VVASKPKMTRPDVYQFRLGDYVVTNLLEGFAQRKDMHPFTAKNASPEEIQAVATAHRLPFPALEHIFVPTLVDTGKQLIAFDPGFGENTPMATAGFFNSKLPAAGYSADDVDMVVVTHCHPDHIGNLATKDGKPTFPNAKIVFGRVDFDYWRRGENVSDMRKPTLDLFRRVCLPVAGQAIFVEAGQVVAPGITAVEAFGHSAGHMAYRIESHGQSLMLMADTVAHFAISISHPEWHFFMDDDPEKAAVSRRRILSTVAEEKIAAIGFHMPFPSVGYIDRRGDGFAWVPASYQMNLA